MGGGKLLIIIILVAFTLPFIYVFYALAAKLVIIFLIAIIYYKRRIPSDIEIKQTDNSFKKELLIFSLPLVFSSMSWFLLQGTDKLMIGFFMNEYNVGVYNAASTISGYLNIFLVSITFIYQPIGSKLYALGDKIFEIKNLYQTSAKWIFFLVSPLILFVLLLPSDTISIIFGIEYIGGAFPLFILFLTYTIRVCLGPADGSIILMGKTKEFMFIVVSVALMNFVLNWLLIPDYGITGAAIATGLSITILNFLVLGFLYKISSIHPIKMLYLKILTVFLSLMILDYIILNFSPLTFSIFDKFLIIIFSYLLFIVFLIIFNLFREEDLLIIKLVEKKLGIKIPFIRKIIRK
jgi:O-antigen/teichoic acid export membrane protein